jgi:hypothetical protein
VFAAGVLAVIWTCFAVLGWHSYRDHVLSLALCDRIDQIVDQAAAGFPDWVERQARAE